jgi:hypothetical protein
MKDKQILTEINRIKEIMGVRLLTEQPQVFDNILTSLVKLSKGGLKSKITKLMSKPNISGVEFRNLVDEIKLMQNVDSGLITLINKFEKSIVNKASSPKYLKHITDRLSDGATESEITNELLSNLNTVYGDFINAKILDDFKLNLSKRIDTIQQKINPPEPAPNPNPNPNPNPIPNPSPINNNSIPNIEKTWNEVTDSIPDETINKISGKYGKWWSSALERLKTTVSVPFKTSLRLQNEIIEDFGIWKLAKPNEKPIIKNKIIAKLKSLETSQKNILEATNSWIEKEIRPKSASDPLIREFYNKIKNKEGWGKIKMLENVYNSINIAMKDILDNGKNLNKAYLKILVKPITIPINIISSIVNKIWSKNLNMLGKLTPEQVTAFKNWFLTTNPAGVKGVRLAFKDNGIIGGMTYVGFQALYRYLWVSTVIGIYRTVGALATEGIDLVADTEMSDNKIINFLFGTKDFDELNKKFKEDPNKSNYEYAATLLEMMVKQSEPFRQWVGMWPLGKVIQVVTEAIKATQNGTLDEEVKKLEEEAKTSEKELEQTTGKSVEEILDNKNNPSPPTPVNTENQYTNDVEGFKKYMKVYMGEYYDESKVSGTKDTFIYDGETLTFNNGKFEE